MNFLNLKYKQLAVISTLMSVMLCLSSCSGESAVTDIPEIDGQIDEVSLFMSIEVRDINAPQQHSRASDYDGYKNAIGKKELMNTLRIIVVDSKGVVEGNQYVRFDESLSRYGQMEFKVSAKDRKTVYVLSNCENYILKDAEGNELQSNYFARLHKGTSIKEDDARAFTLALADNVEPFKELLPITTIEHIYIGSSDVKTDIPVHRAATKYTYRIQNRTPQSISLEGIHISSHADKEFLFPDAVYDVNSSNETIVTSYSTPSGATAKQFDLTLASAVTLPAEMDEPVDIGPIYHLEGLKLTQGNYKTTLTLIGEKQDWKDLYWYAPEGTPDNAVPMRDLPRNTHVVVNVTIQHDYTLEVTVDEQPYAFVELKPIFGLDRDEFGNIVTKSAD